MEDRLCFVQFQHPGDEHRPGRDGITQWNTKDHKRKFLVSEGRYVGDGELQHGKIVFWGEWEPPSRAIPLALTPEEMGAGYPTYLHEPFREERVDYKGLQNTDPFVFGERFYYTGCQQNTKRGPTQLRYLARGSVALFGSHRAGEFLLDSVFVVAEHRDHHAGNYARVLRPKVSPEYWDITIRPWYQEWEGQPVCGRRPVETYRLYSGASHDVPYQGMFSFFPCLPAGSRGFRRPAIRVPNVVNGAVKQGKRLNPRETVAEIRELWQSIVDQVREAGLALGVYAQMPTLRSPMK